MSLLTFEPPVGPSPGTSYKPQLSILVADFGDGYSQPTPNGINHIKRRVSLKWDALTYEQMVEIESFFARHGGTRAFYYQPFGERCTLRWTCRDWSKGSDNGVWKMSAELVQSFTAQV